MLKLLWLIKSSRKVTRLVRLLLSLRALSRSLVSTAANVWYHLYSYAHALETDPTAALPLLRGTIHESDRILRNHDSKEPLPALFYYTYGSALYELGRLTEDEEFEPYLDAAEERLNESLALKDTELHNKIHLALAKIWLAKAASAVSEGDQNIPELSLKALKTLDEALTSTEIPSKTVIELADIVQNHGDLYESLESRNKFRTWAENALEKVLKGKVAVIGVCTNMLISDIRRTCQCWSVVWTWLLQVVLCQLLVGQHWWSRGARGKN